VAPVGRTTTTSPSSSPPCAIGATRMICALPASAGSHTSIQVPPETPARATTPRSLSGMRIGSAVRCGTPAASSYSPEAPVKISADDSVIDLRSDSVSCSNSSSSGMARVSRLPHVRSASSGATRSP